ncbi:MAG TPA: toll/interleukin-1 receptor domain-containing protein [Thermoanaerobaculia bacterium]|nr:toll/interleukin-1 receptor domain-containing protein [Thermoanaerobaculia bacterium]
MPAPTEVFISHSSIDHQFATRIGDVLEAHGISYWYSRRNIVGAQQWHDEIGKALARCDWFLLILSPAAVASKWVKRELFYALRNDAYEGRLVVLDYQPADHERLSWTLPDLQWVDFHQDFEDGCRELLRIWERAYRG